MRTLSTWGRCSWLGNGGRILRPPCAARRTARPSEESPLLSSDLIHLQRSLELGPALKQAPDFDYVAVAFRTEPRPKRSTAPRRLGRTCTNEARGTSKIFGEADARGYRTLEVVSGDRRLLFESTASESKHLAPADVAAVPSDAAVAANSNGRRGKAGGPTRGPPSSSRRHPSPAGVTVMAASGNITAPPAAPSACLPRQSAPKAPPPPAPRQEPPNALNSASPHCHHPTQHHQDHQHTGPQHQEHHHHHQPQLDASRSPRHAASRPAPNTPSSASATSASIEASASTTSAASASASIEAAAALLLQLPRHEVRRHRGLHCELMALQDSPQTLTALCASLLGDLGLTPEQMRHVMLCQPHVLRVPPRALAERGAALAAALELPPPPGAGELAAAVAAAPDVLLRRGGYGNACAALAAALALPQDEARALLRREPQLLRHPPAFFARGMAQLQQHLGLPPAAAAALAAAEPQLLSVSPGVLRANGSMLRSELQLSPQQLGEVAAHAPELLARPPGVLRATAQRMVVVLSHSRSWRDHLPRLLASSRNLAVALSFRSDRYERLDYLAATGRDPMMGFKDALSLDDEDFQEVFPEYGEWRRAHGR